MFRVTLNATAGPGINASPGVTATAAAAVTPQKTKTTFQRVSETVFWTVITFIGGMTLLMLAMTVGPKLGFYQTYSVLSGSMEPTLGVGSMIFLEKVQPQDLRVGDIISVQVPELGGKLVTHRIIELKKIDGGVIFQTKGDANGQKDNWTVTATGAIDGWRYVFGIPWVGYLLAWMQTPFFRLLLVGIPSLIIGFIFLWDIWKPQAAPSSVSALASAAVTPVPALAVPAVKPILAPAPNPVFIALLREKPLSDTRIALG